MSNPLSGIKIEHWWHAFTGAGMVGAFAFHADSAIPSRMLLIAAVFAVAGASASAQDPWQSQSIYQVVTDRFFNGDVSNDNADGNFNASAGQAVHGGDFKGIEQKLDYIKALGATAIWISPVVKNANGDYHGYAGSDFYSVDPHWGTLTDLQNLIQAAHLKGLLVINDVVVNHGSQLLNSNDSGYPNFIAPPNGYNLFYRNNSQQYASPFDPGSGQSLSALFHNNGFIQDFTSTAQAETGFLEGLDDFRTESSYVQTNMANIYEFWLEQGFDGFRVDTVKHVDQGFWQSWCPQIHAAASTHSNPNFFMFGEVYDSLESKNASYTGTTTGPNFELDSVLDYPLYFAINPVFALANSNTKQLEDHYHAVDAQYDPSARMRLVTFLDNHDQPRFLNGVNANNNIARLNVALSFLYTARGIPCLYYGTEQAFNGGSDPNNREDMFSGQWEQGPSIGDNFNETQPIFQLVAKLNNFRRLYPALRTGTHVNLWNDPNGPGLFAYSRVAGSQEILVVFNTAAISETLPIRPSTYSAGTTMVNLFNSTETIVVTSDGQTPAIVVPGTTAKMFIAQTQVLPLNPTVTAVVPTHDAKNVPTSSSIVLNFSKPMDTASVQAAFSTVPTTSGSFVWSQAHDQVTYTVTGGLPALTTMNVHLDGAAAATDGTTFYASFDARFSTAQKTVVDTTPPTITITSPSPGARLTDQTTMTGVASDDTAIAEIDIRLDGGDWAPLSPGSGKTQNWGTAIATQYYSNGPHTISARAIDQAGNISQVVSIPVTFAAVPYSYYEQHIFAAPYTGQGVDDCATPIPNVWISDKPYVQNLQYDAYGYVGGNKAISSNTITNICSNAQEIYRSERYALNNDSFKYVFNLPSGVYQVDILEAETYMNGPNQRRFDLHLQGQNVLPNFDIFAAAGGKNLGITQSFTANAANSLLTLEFRPVYDSARVSAIHVKKLGEVYSDTDGIADWWRLANFGHATGLASDQSRAGDDPDGDGMTNLQEFLANTDPHDKTSYMHVSNIQRVGNDIQITYYGGIGRNQQLQRSSSLSPASWTNIGPVFSFSSSYPPPTVLTDTGGATMPSPQFYRVVVLQP